MGHDSHEDTECECQSSDRMAAYIHDLSVNKWEPFRNTTYRVADYAEPAGEFGLLLNHPRFLEWIRVSQSAGLLELSGMQWVDRFSRNEAVTAAVHLQRDVGLMQTNVDVLDQYALSLQKMVSRIIDTCLGPSKYPASEVETGTLGPRVY